MQPLSLSPGSRHLAQVYQGSRNKQHSLKNDCPPSTFSPMPDRPLPTTIASIRIGAPLWAILRPRRRKRREHHYNRHPFLASTKSGRTIIAHQRHGTPRSSVQCFLLRRFQKHSTANSTRSSPTHADFFPQRIETEFVDG